MSTIKIYHNPKCSKSRATLDLVERKGEDVYKKEYAGKTLSRAQWIEAMVRHPILIERPIVVAGERAVIGRPPENVLTLLEGRR